MIMQNKKGQVPSGITWVVGFIIIFFIMFLFTSTSLYFASKKNIDTGLEKDIKSLVLTKKLAGFLETFVEFDGDMKTASELIIIFDESENEKAEIIEKLGSVFDEPCKNYVLEFPFEHYLCRAGYGDLYECAYHDVITAFGNAPLVSLSIVHEDEIKKINYKEKFVDLASCKNDNEE